MVDGRSSTLSNPKGETMKLTLILILILIAVSVVEVVQWS